VEKVDAGNRLADDAGAAMGEIVDSVKEITRIMSDIATASAEQGAGIEQINRGADGRHDATKCGAGGAERGRLGQFAGTGPGPSRLDEHFQARRRAPSAQRCSGDASASPAGDRPTRGAHRREAGAGVAGDGAQALAIDHRIVAYVPYAAGHQMVAQAL
jgi:hypothetical protein